MYESVTIFPILHSVILHLKSVNFAVTNGVYLNLIFLLLSILIMQDVRWDNQSEAHSSEHYLKISNS